MINVSYVLSTPVAAYIFLPVFYRLQSASVYRQERYCYIFLPVFYRLQSASVYRQERYCYIFLPVFYRLQSASVYRQECMELLENRTFK